LEDSDYDIIAEENQTDIALDQKSNALQLPEQINDVEQDDEDPTWSVRSTRDKRKRIVTDSDDESKRSSRPRHLE
jgi:hypothetical protein